MNLSRTTFGNKLGGPTTLFEVQFNRFLELKVVILEISYINFELFIVFGGRSPLVILLAINATCSVEIILRYSD